MAKLLLLCTFVQTLFLFTCGQAPDDFDRGCTHPTNFRIVPPFVPDGVCVLMDSRYYEALLGVGGVWNTFELDQNGGTWRHGRGGLCTYQVRSCTNRAQFPQENYLLTQCIAISGAHEIWIDVEYRFTSGGYERVFEVLYFETDQTNVQASVNPSNYKVLSRFAPAQSSGSITFTFDTTGKNKVYIAIRENGTCLTISSLRVYTFCCKGQKFGLLDYPTANAPARGVGAPPSLATGVCCNGSSVDDSGSTTTDVSCLNLGRWDTSKDCVCNPGLFYEENNGESTCTPCRPNTYKRFYSNLDLCDRCPANSVSGSGSTKCDCEDGFYRSKDDTSKDPCTAPPSSPLNVAVVESGSTTCEVSWDPPASDGGRTDVFFTIEYQASSRLFRGYLPAGEVAVGSPTIFTVEGLDPVTEYTIRVISENGVSDQDPDSERSRTSVVTCSTTEGVPGKIEVFANTRGSTYTWQPPDNTNGVITGFCCRIFREGKEEEAYYEQLGPLEFCFSPTSSSIPPGTSPVYVQVAAKTAVGVGEFSDPLILEKEKQCPHLSDPSNGEVVVMSALVGGEAMYFCDNGYKLNGVSSRKCQSDETWSGSEPSCDLITCDDLSHPDNGRVTLKGGSAVNSIAEYTCNEGFQLDGDSLRFCRLNGTWTEYPPVCVEVPPTAAPNTLPPVACQVCPTCPSCPTTPTPTDCPVVTCPTTPPPTDCPVVTCPTIPPCPVVTCPTTPMPTDCPVVTCPTTPPPTDCPVVTCPTIPPKECPVVTCNQPPPCPTTLPPTDCPPVVTCPDVTAEPLPQVTCDNVPSLTNGNAEQKGTSLGSVVEYSCDFGFELSGPATRECQAVGAWANTAPICEVILCKDLLSPDNGRVLYTNTSVASIARYTCDQGYSLSGSASRVCRFNGQWSGIEPTCNMNCEPLRKIDNGEVQITGVTLGSLAFYSCNSPYVLRGATTRQCIQGEWTGEEPTCQPPTCVNSGEVFSSCASTCRPTCSNPSPSCFTTCTPGCMCPAGLVLDSEHSRCIDVNECVTFELGGVEYSNCSTVRLGDIGQNSNAVIFRTSFQECCKKQRIGECYDPNGRVVSVRVARTELFRNRGDKQLRLNRQIGAIISPAQEGQYCCNVPVSVSSYKTVCVKIVV